MIAVPIFWQPTCGELRSWASRFPAGTLPLRNCVTVFPATYPTSLRDLGPLGFNRPYAGRSFLLLLDWFAG